MKKSLKRFGPFLAIFTFTLVAMQFMPESASAANAWEKAGIKADGGTTSTNGIFKSLENLIWIITAVGGFWTLACLIFAGMKLSASQGNPQNRTAGFIGLAMAAVGLFVIVKATDIAGWVAGMGTATSFIFNIPL